MLREGDVSDDPFSNVLTTNKLTNEMRIVEISY